MNKHETKKILKILQLIGIQALIFTDFSVASQHLPSCIDLEKKREEYSFKVVTVFCIRS
jgi:hypothetical protein